MTNVPDSIMEDLQRRERILWKAGKIGGYDFMKEVGSLMVEVEDDDA